MGDQPGRAERVAEGLGVTVLPDYSIDGDPLCTAGLVTHRRIAGEETPVRLLMVTRDLPVVPPSLRALQTSLLAKARDYRPGMARSTSAGDPDLPLKY